MLTEIPEEKITAVALRFWPRVEVTKKCWEWQGAKTPRGYGYLQVDRKRQYAHRIAYILAFGKCQDGLVFDHLCRNRACVNPNHLELVTNRVNILRGEAPPAVWAARTHCNFGHELNDQNLIKSRAYRQCRTCRSIENKKHRDKNRDVINKRRKISRKKCASVLGTCPSPPR